MELKEINAIARTIKQTKPRPGDFTDTGEYVGARQQWEDTVYTFAYFFRSEREDFDPDAFIKKCGYQ